jgi:hypothetical protein
MPVSIPPSSVNDSYFPLCEFHFPMNNFNFEHPMLVSIWSPQQESKQTHSHVNDHITGSQALAHLAQRGINMSTMPAGGLNDPQSFEEEEAKTPFDNDVEESFAAASETTAGALSNSESESEFSLEGRWPAAEDLPAGDSCLPKQQLHQASCHVGQGRP